MIIRSQNKKELHNLDKIKMIGFIEISKEFYVEVNSQHTIGIYSTKEKAIKVLDMICEHVEGIHFAKIAPQYCSMILGNVFDMPSDEEVEV